MYPLIFDVGMLGSPAYTIIKTYLPISNGVLSYSGSAEWLKVKFFWVYTPFIIFWLRVSRWDASIVISDFVEPEMENISNTWLPVLSKLFITTHALFWTTSFISVTVILTFPVWPCTNSVGDVSTFNLNPSIIVNFGNNLNSDSLLETFPFISSPLLSTPLKGIFNFIGNSEYIVGINLILTSLSPLDNSSMNSVSSEDRV